MNERRRNFFCRVGAIAAVVALLGGLGVDAAEDPSAAAPGHTLYGDPAAPDISGLWFGNFMVAPGDHPQIQVEPSNMTRWAPWPPPLTPAYQQKADAIAAAAKQGRQLGDIGSKCLPFGQPWVFTMKAYPDEIVQTPGVVMFFVFGTFPVFIWTDGRPHPKDLKPSFNGHSIGTWIGDTLNVDTVGILARTPVDPSRHTPHSAALHMKTTIERVAPDVLHFHVTLFDSEAFTEPMVTTNIFRRKSGPKWQVLDDISCFENFQTDNGPAGFVKF